MSYALNRKALERLKALVRAGNFATGPFSFSVADSNGLLGDDNWTEYGLWFLGQKEGTPDPITNTTVDPTKDWFAYPFGKGQTVSLTALQQIVQQAKSNGDLSISTTAAAVLDTARKKQTDKVTASADPHDRHRLTFTAPANIVAGEASIGAPPTFTMDAYTGGPMVLEGWQHPVVVDLDGVDKTAKSRPVLRDHDTKKPLGHTTDIGVSNGVLTAAGIISGSGEHVDETVNAAKKGFPWQASIRAKVLKNQFVPQGQTAEANGRTWSGPVNIARRTSLREISVLALGADDDTSTRIAASAAERPVMKFKAWMKAHAFKAADMSAEAMKCAIASFKAEYPDGDTDDDSDDDDDKDTDKDDDKDDDKKKKDAAAAAARSREVIAAAADSVVVTTAKIREIQAAEYKRVAKISKVAIKYPEIAAKAVEEGWDENKTELEVLRADRPRASSTFGINTGAGMEVTPQIAAAAAALNGNVLEKYALDKLSDKHKEIAASTQMRRNTGSIFGLCQIIAAAHGKHLHASRMDDDVIKQIFSIDRKVMEIQADGGGGGGGGFSTMSLSGILENILNKGALQAYGTVDSVVDQIAYQTDTNDFKVFKRYRLTGSGTMQPVGTDGELKNMSLQDESYPNQVSTVGCVINVPRPILIGDDLGMLTEIPQTIGREAAMTREQALFTLFLNLVNLAATGPSVGQAALGFNFFSNGATNYLSGASSAFSISAMSLAVQKFMEQVDANNRPVNVMPDRLLVPPALKTAALELFKGTSQIVTALGSTTSKATAPNVNVHASTYTPVMSPFLANRGGKGLAGSSDTAWWLLPNPAAGMAVVQIGYLRGQRVPVIQQGEPNFNTLGIALRAFYDFGVAAHDWRCGVMSAGA